MKFILIFFSLYSFQIMAQSGDLEIKFVARDRSPVATNLQIHQVEDYVSIQKLKPWAEFSLVTYIWGLEAGLDGKIKGRFAMDGKSRDKKNLRYFERRLAFTSNLRADEIIPVPYDEMFHPDDIGIWDFKVTVTDDITGKSVSSDITIEVRK